MTYSREVLIDQVEYLLLNDLDEENSMIGDRGMSELDSELTFAWENHCKSLNW
jgi:hypothetical protein